MMFKKIIISILFVFTMDYGLWTMDSSAQEQTAQESDQQISDFSLAGYADKGKKSWDISGKTADIFESVIKLKDVIGNLYGEKENTKLTAQKGDFDKVEGRVHLEKDVVITTTSGARLTTDSLDWDRKNQLLSTKDKVNIERENMITQGIGAIGHPNLSKVNLQKEVQVEIDPNKPGQQQKEGPQGKIIITCDGPLEIDYAKNIATFKNNVKVDNKDSIIYSDIMDVYFLTGKQDEAAGEADPNNSFMMGSKIDKIIARGNVKIVKGENTSYSDEATYKAADKRIILTGKPRLIIYSTKDFKGLMEP